MLGDPVLQLFGGLFLVGLVPLVVFAAVLWSGIVIVDAHEKRALTVFGEYRTMLEPGINFVPPFVSETDSFDMRARTLELTGLSVTDRERTPATVDVAVERRVRDPELLFDEVDDHERAVRDRAETVVRRAVADTWLDDVREDPRDLADRISEDLRRETADWGIGVTGVTVRSVAGRAEDGGTAGGHEADRRPEERTDGATSEREP